ncbi:putative neprosin [Tanacetum coccineum]|uniref:Neprosin n=1 Tax=Tanacetum coccineum TaxID=301880 RepID=A0ABQ4XJY3_9ASTR
MEQTKTLQNSASSSKVPSQTWHKYGRCPNGTIPICRPSTNYPAILMRRRNDITNANHSFAVVFTGGFSYSGAKGNIKVFRPFVESNDDYSSSQVMIMNGPLKWSETIEAGWAVNPRAYNDNKTHFFAYWTPTARKEEKESSFPASFGSRSKETKFEVTSTRIHVSFLKLYRRMVEKFAMMDVARGSRLGAWLRACEIYANEELRGNWPAGVTPYLIIEDDIDAD